MARYREEWLMMEKQTIMDVKLTLDTGKVPGTPCLNEPWGWGDRSQEVGKEG